METSAAALSGADSLRPLLRRAPLLPGESLLSLLERLTQLNFYPRLRFLVQLCRERAAEPLRADNPARSPSQECFRHLAYLTGLSPDALWAASDHRFAPVLNPPGQTAVGMPVDRARARQHLRSPAAAQFCPRCLKGAPCHRLNWIPVASAVCLEHQCLLIDRCPRCHRALTVLAVVTAHCLHCYTDLRRVRTVSMAHDAPGILAQQAIQSWLTVAKAPPVSADVVLPEQPPGVLYDWLHKLAQRLLAIGPETLRLPAALQRLADSIPPSIRDPRQLSPGQVYALCRSAFAGLLNWPQGLFDFLDACSGYEAASSSPPVRIQAVLALQHAWLDAAWRDTPWETVQQQFVDYLLARHLPLSPAVVEQWREVPWFVERTGLWTAERSAQALGLPMADWRRCEAAGLLNHCRWSGARARTPMFEWDQVLALQRRWARGWPLQDASRWLGVGESDVLRLVEMGELRADDGGNREDPLPRFSRQALAEFFERVVARLEWYGGERSDLRSIWEVIGLLSGLGLDGAMLLQGVTAGILPAYKREAELSSLYGVYFLDSMLPMLLDRLYAERGWVAGFRFAEEKGLSPLVVWDWLRAGLITPVAVTGDRPRYFLREQLERQAACWLSAGGASLTMGEKRVT